MNIPIDAVPDMTNVQVQVVTKAGSLSPLEVEHYVTYPVETTMNGLPNVQEIRSLSKFGLSLVTIVFHEGTDILSGSAIGRRAAADAAERMIRGYGSPQIGVLADGTGRNPAIRSQRRRATRRWNCGRCSNGKSRRNCARCRA